MTEDEFRMKIVDTTLSRIVEARDMGKSPEDAVVLVMGHYLYRTFKEYHPDVKKEDLGVMNLVLDTDYGVTGLIVKHKDEKVVVPLEDEEKIALSVMVEVTQKYLRGMRNAPKDEEDPQAMD